MAALIQPLFDGPLDIVGDVHGEIGALRSLLEHLGYDEDGGHCQGRRLAFLGDLTDRGPDSPAVVDLVRTLIDAGRAQCVLGNHDLNILLNHRKPENKWYWGEEFLDEHGLVAPQVLADSTTQQRVCGFLRTLPIALEREDLRVIHACWDDRMVGMARDASNAVDWSLVQALRGMAPPQIDMEPRLDKSRICRENRAAEFFLPTADDLRTARQTATSNSYRPWPRPGERR